MIRNGTARAVTLIVTDYTRLIPARDLDDMGCMHLRFRTSGSDHPDAMFRSGTGVLSLTEESFDREVTEFSDLPVLVFFGAPCCEACLAMVPELAGVADRFEGRLRVVEVDVEADPSLRSRFGIRRIPALTLFVDGQVAEHEVGSNGLGVLLPVLEAGCPGPGVSQ